MKIRNLDPARLLLGRPVLSAALTLGLLTLTSPASAQDDPFASEGSSAEAAPTEEPAADTAAPSDTEESSASEAPAEPQEPAAPEEAPASEASAEGEAAASTEGEVSADAAVAAATTPAAEGGSSGSGIKPPPIAVERLPDEAYPLTPLRGIEWGSLFLTMNRHQWPYMPMYEGQPRLRIGFSGNSWVDSNFRQIKAGQANEDDQTEYRMQGRLTFRVTPVYNFKNDWFVQSNTEFIANVEQNNSSTNYVDVDEAWIRFGKWKHFDLQVGRMQGFEVYHFGMGLDLNTYERQGAVTFSTSPAQPYGLTDLWDRGVNNGAAAVHWYGPQWLRLEFLTRFGLSSQGTDIGIRPVGVLDFGFAKLKAGYERRLKASIFNNNDGRIEMQGLAANLQFVLDPWVEFGGGAGHRVQDEFESDGAVVAKGSHTTWTAGGFVNVRPYFKDWLVGLGYHHTYFENFNFDEFDEPENSAHDQMYVAVQYQLWDALLIKYVLAYSNGHIEERNDSDQSDTGFNNESLSHRLRLMLFF